MQARINGDLTYQGRPCPAGHPGVRYISNQECIDCRSPGHAQRRLYREARAAARTSGERTYQGKVCVNGHDGVRSTATNACVECEREREARRLEAETPEGVECERERAREDQRQRKIRDPALALWKQARARAHRKGLDFSIQVSDVVIPKRCPVLGFDLVLGASWDERQRAPSLDRVDNTKGYVPGNVAVISLRANTIKNDSLLEELELVAAYIRSQQSK